MSSSTSNNQNSRKKTYKARFEHLDQMREFVGKAAEDSGLMSDAVYQVKLAVDEAFTNIIEHAYDGECDQEVEVICLLSKDGITIIIKDCGISFKPEDIQDPDLDANIVARQVGGLGLYFIRQLMDEVDFIFDQENSHGRVCNLLRMVKRKDK